MTTKSRHEGASLDSMFEELRELQEVREIALWKTPAAKRKSARRDAEVARDAKAGVGIPLAEAFSWLNNRIDGVQRAKPKARKL